MAVAAAKKKAERGKMCSETECKDSVRYPVAAFSTEAERATPEGKKAAAERSKYGDDMRACQKTVCRKTAY